MKSTYFYIPSKHSQKTPESTGVFWSSTFCFSLNIEGAFSTVQTKVRWHTSQQMQVATRRANLSKNNTNLTFTVEFHLGKDD